MLHPRDVLEDLSGCVEHLDARVDSLGQDVLDLNSHMASELNGVSAGLMALDVNGGQRTNEIDSELAEVAERLSGEIAEVSAKLDYIGESLHRIEERQMVSAVAARRAFDAFALMTQPWIDSLAFEDAEQVSRVLIATTAQLVDLPEFNDVARNCARNLANIGVFEPELRAARPGLFATIPADLIPSHFWDPV